MRIKLVGSLLLASALTFGLLGCSGGDDGSKDTSGVQSISKSTDAKIPGVKKAVSPGGGAAGPAAGANE